ncbi:MAG: hypothetical protein COV45_07880 [Deltaproteobacteria bacterium CG11_big_fil_rev_8_21_14_0_20_47_16]|nr:MAG: hypothetical protein COV45_07880 [Deltaproteobacteria bacterium CG11_big_fil_rev_8_21_14_0_20_47_16]
MQRQILSILLVLVALPVMAMEGGKMHDEHRLGPPEEKVLKILWQQQKAWQAPSLGYFTKTGVLIDADHPMDQKKQASLVTLSGFKLGVINVVLKELVPTMLMQHPGSSLFKGGAPEGEAYIFHITPRAQDYLKKIGVK